MPQKKRRQPLVLQTFTNDPDMIAKLRRLSHKKNVSVSSIIRDALQSYFANQLTVGSGEKHK